ncbi:hypothetical protein [Myroides phaeus]|uniref:Uncharacterized protein n=1 Tax=Myroides phaeus TaxID=702745 RepID=A0A1G8C4N6_9FLAO|nr:hypothetical protein [Myroides phaeus]SDH40461.1 hypothetical protein SAMN05421818_103128 [Myroides phaeus]
MKKVIFLFLILTSLSSVYGQRKSKKVETKPKIEYLDIREILENTSELGLTSKQTAAFTIKNEFIKRDLQNLNSKTDLDPAELKMNRRDLVIGYTQFIERTLTEDQLENWTKIKKEIEEAKAGETDYKTELRELETEYKANVKEIYRRYSKDRKIYYAQRDIARKQLEGKKLKLQKKYEVANLEEGAEDEKVLSLEEIANLTKEFDDYYNEPTQRSPLEYLEIREENSNGNGEVQYNEEEGDY